MKIFAEYGFHASRLEDIALAAGFSKASLYNYYENKECIFLGLAIREHEKLLETVEQELDVSEPLDQNLKRALVTAIKNMGQHFAIVLEITSMGKNGILPMAELLQNHPHQLEKFRYFTKKIEELFVTLFSAGRKRSEITSPLSDRVLAKYFGAQVRGLFFEWKMAGKMGDIEKEIESMVQFVLYGFCGKQ